MTNISYLESPSADLKIGQATLPDDARRSTPRPAFGRMMLSVLASLMLGIDRQARMKIDPEA
jgi:hypothetical protein